MRLVLVKAYLLPEEKARLVALAGRLNLSLSELIRRVMTEARIETDARREDIRDLLKVNADLARLGNLLRLALDDPGWRAPGRPDADVESLITRIRETQALIKARVAAL